MRYIGCLACGRPVEREGAHCDWCAPLLARALAPAPDEREMDPEVDGGHL